MYEQLRAGIDRARLRGGGEGVTPPWVALTSGGLARVVAATIVSPLELVRTKMQSRKMGLGQVSRCLQELVAAQGVRGLWNGYTATLLRFLVCIILLLSLSSSYPTIHLHRDVPFSALYWPLYEQTKAQLTLLYPPEATNSFLINFSSGAVAGSVASAVTLPFDVLKTIKQIDMGERDIMGVKPGTAMYLHIPDFSLLAS